MRAKVSDWRGLCLRTSAKWADFVAQSLHWKLPFPTQVRDWFDDWVVGSQFDIYCLHHPVLPKPQIPAPPLNRPFLWGFSLVSFRSFRLWRHFAVSQPDFSLPSLHPKIPFPASGFSTARSRSAAGNFWGYGGQKRRFEPGPIISADSIQGLRTVGSILPEHHEVARLQYRAANDLRPRRGRDLVRGTRARSSC
jgi:hypothetical protein